MLRQSLILSFIAVLLMVQFVWAQNDTCPDNYQGFLLPRLEIGMRGRVTADGSGNRLRENPSASAAQLGILPASSEFEVIGGPSCDAESSIIWWQVRADDGLEGWTAEGLVDSGYFLEPLQTIEASPSATASPTRIPTATPSPINYVPLDLPRLALLSPENLENLELLAEIPTTGRAFSLFFSPDMLYIFIVSITEDRRYYANVYSFPALQAVAQGIPLNMRDGEILFTDDSQIMVAIHHNNSELSFYQLGESGFVLDTGGDIRYIRSADLSSDGILALGFGNLGRTTMDAFLCFIDKFGESYSPDESLCLDVERGILALEFLPNGSVLAGNTDELLLYDTLSGEVLERFSYGIQNGGTMAILPNSAQNGDLPSVLLSREGFVLSVNLQTGEERSFASGQGQIVREIIVNSDGNQMIFISPTNNVPDIFVVDFASGEILHQNSLFGGEGTAYNPAGNLAYINNEVYETENWQLIREFTGHQHIIGFSPDGKLLLLSNTNTNQFELYGLAN